MRILVLNNQHQERESMVRALLPASFRVEVVPDEHAAVAAIAREPPQVIVFGVPSLGGVDLVRRLRGADASGRAYLLAVLDSAASGDEVSNLFAEGIHDLMRRPLVDAEFLARVNARGRFQRRAHSVVNNPTVAPDLSRLRAWSKLGSQLAADLATMIGQPCTASEGWPRRFSSGLRSATIIMSLAADQVEGRVSIAVDPTTLTWLRATLLGDTSASDAATDDALRELANTAGGALKRSALSENVVLTAGIPMHDGAVSLPGPNRCWSLVFEGGEGCFGLVGEIRRRQNQRVLASQLSEGMVLTHDVRSERGVLLVTAGSRLTSSTAAKLARVLGPTFFLEVAHAT